METRTAILEKPVAARRPQANPAALLQRKCDCGPTATTGSGECEQCKKKKLQRRAEDSCESTAAPPIVDEVLQSPGHPLDAATRSFMEPRFGHDFSKVRVHTGHKAAESAKAVHAHAYTVGHNVVFAGGQYAPGRASGQKLLAHELTHVVQQRRMQNEAPRARLEVGPVNDSLEQQADRFAEWVAGVSAMGPAPPPNSLSGSQARLQRALDDQAPVAAATIPPATGPIVEDEAQQVGSGQMRKTEFLNRLQRHVCSVADSVLVSVGRTAQGCPMIERWIGHLRARNIQYIERGIRVYASPGPQATAQDYIIAVGERVRQGVSRWAATGEISGVPPELMAEMPGGGILGAIGSAVSGIIGGIGSAISGIGRLFAKANEGGAREGNPMAIQAQLSSANSAKPLESGVRARMETAFGHSFGRVRVHADSRAAQLSSSLNARAFTIGSDVAFAAGEYNPGTLIGDALIAHELAHVIQQQGGASTPMAKGATEYGGLEEDADLSAVGAMVSLWSGAKSGLANVSHRVMPALRSGLRLQRCYGPKLVQKGQSVLADKVAGGAIEARIGDVVEDSDKYSGLVGLEYRGADARNVRWIQFVWAEMIATTPQGDVRVPVNGPIPNSGKFPMLMTTNPSSPSWTIDVSKKSGEPFYESKEMYDSGLTVRSDEAVTMFDQPSAGTEGLADYAFKKNPTATSIKQIDHFDSYAVKGSSSKGDKKVYTPIYHITWDAAADYTKQGQATAKQGPTYKVTGGGKVTQLPMILGMIVSGNFPKVEVK